MGWTSYRASHWKNGKIDRKAEVRDYFNNSIQQGIDEIVKDTMKGSVYYGAIRRKKYYDKESKRWQPLPQDKQYVYAVVFLTSVSKWEFAYKGMDETVGPCYYECPENILKLLSETDNQCALEWRKKCHEAKERLKRIKALAEKAKRDVVEVKFSRDITWDDGYTIPAGSPCQVFLYKKTYCIAGTRRGISNTTFKNNIII